MKHDKLPVAIAAALPSIWRRMAAAWDAFWFTPADPTLLGLMRVLCGAITFYTTLMYSFTLMDFMGPQAWYDLELREQQVLERPIVAVPLDWYPNPSVRPKNAAEQQHYERYYRLFGDWPPPPYPTSKREEDYIEHYRGKYGFDLRHFGLPPPDTEQQRKDLEEYTERFRSTMPPPYPVDAADKARIYDYIERFNVDPRRSYTTGLPIWSVWFHVTDPTAMTWVHGFFVLATLLFAAGFATRVTSFITWFGALSYIHRNPIALFGVDTMMNILLIYFMVGPSGAALSLDRAIARWWSKARARFYGASLPFDDQPKPLVSANLAIRLIQIHVCIIYGAAGLSKLLGPAWWNGTAVWGTLANYEFAPMQYWPYNTFLRTLGANQFVFETFLTVGSYFTLVFEIGYLFLIWRPRLRWIVLFGAIVLHGVIGMFMGLKTFALIMLVMNMAFLTPREAHWMGSLFSNAPPPNDDDPKLGKARPA